MKRRVLLRPPRPASRRHAQRGVALIVVLVILVVVTFMGLVAMRMGMLHTITATNSQVNSLLFQNADAGTNGMLNTISSSTATVTPTNPAFMAVQSPGTEQKGCLTTTGVSFTSGSCDPSNSTNFDSGRGAAIVQLGIVVPTNAAGGAQTVTQWGTQAGVLPPGSGTVMNIYSTAVVPSFGSATTSQITNCFTYPSEGTGTTVSSCLVSNGASFETTVQQVSLGF